MNRLRLFLLLFASAALACSTFLPARATPSLPGPAATLAPSPTVPPPTRTPEVMLPGGQRACGYTPGVSVAALPFVPPAATPTPFPLPALPANTPVAADVTARQLQVWRGLWNAVNDHYVYRDFNGRDWPAIGESYRRLVQGGLTDDDFYSAMQRMVRELGDDHSYFQDPAAVQAEAAEMAGQLDYVGVGLYILPIPAARLAAVIAVFPDSPAGEAGLGSHDLLLAVDGQPLVDETGVYTNTLRGPEGTAVTLTIQRQGGRPFDLTLTRRRVTGALPFITCLIPDVRIGYIFIPTLLDETIPAQVGAALEQLTADGPLNGLVLDNRLNDGGQGSVLEGVLRYFTSGRLGSFVSSAKTRPLTIEPVDIGGSQSVPLVVLVDEDTASFCEVMSGVLQASGRAKVVGRTTLGNVETLHRYDFEDGSLAWLAAEVFQPQDQPAGLWEDTGIVPDVSVPTRWDLFSEATDPALAAAVKWLTNP